MDLCYRLKVALPQKAAVFALALLCALLAGCAHKPAQSQSFTFVQICDPQIGFTDYAADLARFRQAVKQVNDLRPDLVVICGDLVNGASRKTFADFNAAKAALAMPCYCAAGNHDVGNTPTLGTLQRYRELVGKDYYSFQHKGCVFVVVNSQLWVAPIPGESEKQDVWLRQTLETAAKGHHPIFVVAHYPLFEKEPDEPESYYNLPEPKRHELLALFKRCGVVAVLAGHTHKTIVNQFQGIQMVTAETTSRNFDKRPFGFRVWHVGPTRPFRHEFVPISE